VTGVVPVFRDGEEPVRYRAEPVFCDGGGACFS